MTDAGWRWMLFAHAVAALAVVTFVYLVVPWIPYGDAGESPAPYYEDNEPNCEITFKQLEWKSPRTL